MGGGQFFQHLAAGGKAGIGFQVLTEVRIVGHHLAQGVALGAVGVLALVGGNGLAQIFAVARQHLFKGGVFQLRRVLFQILGDAFYFAVCGRGPLRFAFF